MSRVTGSDGCRSPTSDVCRHLLGARVGCGRVSCPLLAVLGVLLAALLLQTASALAVSPAAHVAREHVFSFAFGGQGTGEDQFAHPSGLAVSTSTGDVYVADRENKRIEQFTPVLGGEGEVTGVQYAVAFAVPFPGQIAVDNCTTDGKPCTEAEDPSVGDVYVAGAKTDKSEASEDTLLYKFTSSGVAVGTPHKLKHPIDGIAVGSSGTVYVYEEDGAIAEFTDVEANIDEKKPAASVQSATKGSAQSGLAVDADGNLYVGAALKAEEAIEDEGLFDLLSELETEYGFLHENEKRPSEPRVAKLEGSTGQVLVPELDYEATTAVAVDPTAAAGNEADEGDAFVTNVAKVGGGLADTVAVFAPEPEPAGGKVEELHGQLVQRFDTPGLQEPDAIAVDSANGALYVAGGGSDTVDVFNLEPRGLPTVGALRAVRVHARSNGTVSGNSERHDARGTGQLRWG